MPARRTRRHVRPYRRHMGRFRAALPAAEPFAPPHELVILRRHFEQLVEPDIRHLAAAATLEPHRAEFAKPGADKVEAHPGMLCLFHICSQ